MGVAPFGFGYSNNTYALWTSIILGAGVLVASIIEAFDARKAKWEYWVAGLAGLAAVIAPFVFGFTTLTMALWTTIVLGAIVLILAGYKLFFVPPLTS
jgi:hypothetical protein